MTQRVIENKLKWSSDNASVQATVKDIESIRRAADAAYEAQVRQYELERGGRSALAAIGQQADRDYEALVAATNAETDALRAQSRQVQDLTDLYEGLETQSKRSGSVIRDIGVQSTRELPEPSLSAFGLKDQGSGTGAISGLRNAAIALPGVGYQSPLVVGLRVAEAAAEKTGASMLELGASAGLVGASLLLLKIVFDKFNEGIEQAKQRLGSALGAQQNYYDAVLNLTQDQAQQQITQLKDQRAVIEQQLAETRNASEQAFAQAQQKFSDPLARVLFAVYGGDLTSKQADLEKQLQTNIDTTTRLTDAYDNGAFAANGYADAIENLKKLTDDAARSLIQQYDQEAQLHQQLSDLRRSGSSDQVREQIASNNDRFALIEHEKQQLQAAGFSSDEFTKRLGELNVEENNLIETNRLLTESVLPVIQMREREAQITKALADKSDALNEILQDQNRVQVDLAAASQKSTESYQALLDAQAENRQNLQEIQDRFDEAQTNALKKKNDRIEQIEQQSAERQLEQRENDTLNILSAGARGDFAQVQQILRQQKLRERQQTRQDEQAKEQADETYKDELEAARKQNEKLLEAERQRYEREYQQKLVAHQRDLQEERALLNRQEQLRQQNAFSVQYWNNVVSASYGQLGNASQQLALQIAAAAASVTASSGKLSGKTGSKTGGTGGAFSSLALSEARIPTSALESGGVSSTTVNISVDARGSGMNEEALARKIGEVVKPMIRNGQVEVVIGMASKFQQQKGRAP